VIITNIETYLVVDEMFPRASWRTGLDGIGGPEPHLWVRVVTDDGHDGWNLIARRGDVAQPLVAKYMRGAIVGLDARDRELAWATIWARDHLWRLPLWMIGTIDTALWDLAARAAGMPLFRFAGGYRTAIPAYASLATFSDDAEHLDVIDQCLGLGVRAIKLHSYGDVRRDIRLAERVREHVGPEIELMFDGSGGFDPYDALRLGRVLESMSYVWFEEPMEECHIDLYVDLCARLEIPILAAETIEGSHRMAAHLLMAKGLGMVRTDVGYKGGVTGALRIAHLAEAFGRLVQAPTGLVNLHVACAIPNTTHYEWMALSNPVRRSSPDIDDAGLVAPPDRAGVGWEVDVDDLRQRAVSIDR
jgi:L-alanine-DL-glutamate epimerase-like enolase superfamily enzyme